MNDQYNAAVLSDLAYNLDWKEQREAVQWGLAKIVDLDAELELLNLQWETREMVNDVNVSGLQDEIRKLKRLNEALRADVSELDAAIAEACEMNDKILARIKELEADIEFNESVYQENAAIDRQLIDQLEAEDDAFIRRSARLAKLGPADIGMVPIPITAEIIKLLPHGVRLWREATDDE